jgi:hypothetical protein
MIKHDPRAPVRFGQTIDAQLPRESAAIEGNGLVVKFRKVHFARHDVAVDGQCAAARVIEPEIDARHISGGYRIPRARDQRKKTNLCL